MDGREVEDLVACGHFLTRELYEARAAIEAEARAAREAEAGARRAAETAPSVDAAGEAAETPPPPVPTA